MAQTRIERKCRNCGQWDVDAADICPVCGTTLNPKIAQVEAAQKREALRLAKPPSFLDRFFARWRESSNPFVRFTFFAVYGMWMLYAAILGFFLWLIAALPG